MGCGGRCSLGFNVWVLWCLVLGFEHNAGAAVANVELLLRGVVVLVHSHLN